jgi:hypothetical protein
MPYDDEDFYYRADDAPTAKESAYVWATLITLAIGFCLFAVIGFCDVVHGLVEAVRKFHS